MQNKLICEIQEDLKREQEQAGIPHDQQRVVPPDIIRSVEQSIDENEEALKVLARF